MRGSTGVAKVPVEFLVKYICSFHEKIHSPPFCCAVVLEICIRGEGGDQTKTFDRICSA